MLFFRSEEQVDAWCRAAGRPRRPLVDLEQLWGLAVAWYASRLGPDARRPGPREMHDIFAGLGLTGEFWNPESTAFDRAESS